MSRYNNSHSSLNRIASNLSNVDLQYFIGVDVGSGSARAAICSSAGNILSLAERPIIRQELKPDYITQSTTEIWDAVCFTVKTVIRDSGVDPSLIYGIGFDATCSLVVIDGTTDEPLAVGPDFENDNQNIIMWMDHRALEETAEINKSGYFGLKYVGGQMSVEMEIPKIKWLRNNMPPKKFKNSLFFDLPDYLVYRATSVHHRSYCSTVCKQGLVPPGVDGQTSGWSKEFFEAVDLPELVADDFRKLGGSPGNTGKWFSAGESVGPLSTKAAEELGLTTNCYVGSGVIDCYSGWVGTIAGKTDVAIPELDKQDQEFTGIDKAFGRLAAVAGTSTCHCVMSKDAVFVPGVWGPYRDIMAPGYWLAEGGQSCTGALLAHVLSTHPAYGELSQKADASNISKFDYLNSVLERLKVERKERSVVSLAKHLFLYGDFHGNRSPIADPTMRASIIGQSLDTSLEDLAIMYLGACEFIAQQTRQIVEAMETAGHKISTIFMSGGQCRNGLLMRLLADCVGKPVVIPRYIDAAVVFGSAILGAVAAESVPRSLKRSNSISFLKSGPSFINHHHKPLSDLPSPYTVPTATASSANIASLASVSYTTPTPEGYPFPVMTPMDEKNEFDLIPHGDSQAIEDDDDDDDDEEDGAAIQFGAQNKNFEKVFNDRLKLGHTGSSPVQHSVSGAIITKSRASSIGKTAEKPGDKLWLVMEKMSGPGKVVSPSPNNDPDRILLAAKYKIFLDMLNKQREYRALVDGVEAMLCVKP
ncbi:putative phosphotransferase [Saccharomycopsis crataegensis]|uniref:Phosphotransferase n=1 Tax=Saccharomycopsis crataegensis TaxID=43959 RepID=A0AAV5QLZ2_9ASCO|nr:putative phosphotransferase [Saccharomycopsis crataegensis]